MRRACAICMFLAVAGCHTTPPAVPSPPVSRPAVDLLGSLTLLDASFASDVHDRVPARLSRTASLSPAEQSLLFWMELGCIGLCEQRLSEAGHVPVFLDWYKEQDGLLLKQGSTQLSIKGTRWRTWGTKRVTPGKWVTVVRTEGSAWVCLQQQCHFSIDVQP